jgi:hypothetical protein
VGVEGVLWADMEDLLGVTFTAFEDAPGFTRCGEA